MMVLCKQTLGDKQYICVKESPNELIRGLQEHFPTQINRTEILKWTTMQCNLLISIETSNQQFLFLQTSSKSLLKKLISRTNILHFIVCIQTISTKEIEWQIQIKQRSTRQNILSPFWDVDIWNVIISWYDSTIGWITNSSIDFVSVHLIHSKFNLGVHHRGRITIHFSGEDCKR